MNTRSLPLSAACVAAAALLTACGGAPADPNSAAGRYETGISAGAAQDFTTFCGVIDPEEVQLLEEASSKTCAEALKAEPDIVSELVGYRDVSVDASRVTEDGDTATIPGDAVTYTSDNGDETKEEGETRMVRRNGTWYLTFADAE